MTNDQDLLYVPLNEERLAKVLIMLTSPNDNEVVVAARTLNRLLDASGFALTELQSVLMTSLRDVSFRKQLDRDIAQSWYRPLDENDLRAENEKLRAVLNMTNAELAEIERAGIEAAIEREKREKEERRVARAAERKRKKQEQMDRKERAAREKQVSRKTRDAERKAQDQLKSLRLEQVDLLRGTRWKEYKESPEQKALDLLLQKLSLQGQSRFNYSFHWMI